MAAKLAVIRRELADNIDSYLDERLPYSQGRNMVAEAGAQLKPSRALLIASVVGVVFGLALFLIRILITIFSSAPSV
jgi:hypothetical protein